MTGTLLAALLIGALAFPSVAAFVAGWALADALDRHRGRLVPLLALARRKWCAYCHARTQTAEVSEQPDDVPSAEQTTPAQVSGTGHPPAPVEATPAAMAHPCPVCLAVPRRLGDTFLVTSHGPTCSPYLVAKVRAELEATR